MRSFMVWSPPRQRGRSGAARSVIVWTTQPVFVGVFADPLAIARRPKAGSAELEIFTKPLPASPSSTAGRAHARPILELLLGGPPTADRDLASSSLPETRALVAPPVAKRWGPLHARRVGRS